MVNVEGLAHIEAMLRAHAFTFTDEHELQDGIAQVLSGLPGYQREFIMSRADRPDFFLDGVAIEVKIDGGLSDLTRQVHRYAQDERVSAVIVVTSRHRLTRLPEAMNGKPIRVVKVGTL